MKRTFLIIIGILLLAISSSAQEQQYKLRHDSLYVYQSWEHIFDGEVDFIIVNPDILTHTPFDVEFDAVKNDLRKIVNDIAVAVSVGDSLWYINSKWIKKNFKGDCKGFRDYVPLYFSAKIAFVQWGKQFRKFTVNDDDNIDYSATPPEGKLYLLDFETGIVELIDSDKLSQLLTPYHDLRRRYEMMHDYDKTYVINDFFLQYVGRINNDPDVPYLF